jgi:xanthine dehydrogenase accessory factor
VTELRALLDRPGRFALATVLRASGSAPRPVGTTMAVRDDGSVIGSLSGGCVEAAVHEAALEVLRTGEPRVETYGIADDDAFAVGLTCGGTISVLVRPGSAETLARVLDHEAVALATVVDTGAEVVVTAEEVWGTTGDSGLDVAVVADARGALAAGRTVVRHYGSSGERRVDDTAVLVQVWAPPARMLVYGATDFARALAGAGRFLGYRVTVCDARPVFATTARFPEADEVVNRWPHDHLRDEVAAGRVDERTVIAVLTHDPRFDVPLLVEALTSPAGYVGAMGSRRTHDARMVELRAAGLDAVALSRLRSPIGLDIGGRTPEETAVSIVAEIVQQRWGGTGQPLSRTDGDIHWTVEVPQTLVP